MAKQSASSSTCNGHRVSEESLAQLEQKLRELTAEHKKEFETIQNLVRQTDWYKMNTRQTKQNTHLFQQISSSAKKSRAQVEELKRKHENLLDHLQSDQMRTIATQFHRNRLENILTEKKATKKKLAAKQEMINQMLQEYDLDAYFNRVSRHRTAMERVAVAQKKYEAVKIKETQVLSASQAKIQALIVELVVEGNKSAETEMKSESLQEELTQLKARVAAAKQRNQNPVKCPPTRLVSSAKSAVPVANSKFGGLFKFLAMRRHTTGSIVSSPPINPKDLPVKLNATAPASTTSILRNPKAKIATRKHVRFSLPSQETPSTSGSEEPPSKQQKLMETEDENEPEPEQMQDSESAEDIEMNHETEDHNSSDILNQTFRQAEEDVDLDTSLSFLNGPGADTEMGSTGDDDFFGGGGRLSDNFFDGSGDGDDADDFFGPGTQARGTNDDMLF